MRRNGPSTAHHHALRVALGAPLAFGVALYLAFPLPFIAPLIFTSLALGFIARPPLAAWVGVLAIVWLLPGLFVWVAATLQPFAYLQIAAIGATLFLALRLQASAQTRSLGSLIATFTILMPVMTDQAVFVGQLVALSLAQNTSVAVAVLALVFMAFPGMGSFRASQIEGYAGAQATRWAATGALVLLPVITLILFLDAMNAVRVLLVSASLVAASGVGGFSVTLRNAIVSVGLAGAGVCAITLLFAIWPSVPAAVIAMSLLTLALAPAAVANPINSPAAAALPVLWVIAVLGGDAPLEQTARMAAYAGAAGLYVMVGLTLVRQWPSTSATQAAKRIKDDSAV